MLMCESIYQKCPKEVICVQTYHSPYGNLLLGSFHQQLCLCCWEDSINREVIKNRVRKFLKAQYVFAETSVILHSEQELDEYFSGKRIKFDIPLIMSGTDFQIVVWKDLLNIPYGQTSTYLKQAIRLNKKQAVRAVANADKANSLVLFIPCHRIIASNNSLSGYSGGIERKSYLLKHEQKYFQK